MRESLLGIGIVIVVAPLAVRVGPAGAASGETVSPPSTITADCSADVSKSLGPWLNALPPGTTVSVPPGSCYQVDRGLALKFPTGLTIDGGTFENAATAPPAGTTHALQRGFPVFNVLGGSGVTFENLTIEGADPTGLYTASMAFAGGIELQGTSSATISQVAVEGVFGDGVTLAPLRGGKNHNSGRIKSAVHGVTISGLTINGAGRMGITFGSVDGAAVSEVTATDVGLDTFDVEADQANEGAVDVTIDGCTSSSPMNTNQKRSFFSNDGPGAATRTGNITVENCTMTEPQGTAAVQALNPRQTAAPRGPIVFDDDALMCGQSSSSVYIACVMVQNSDVTVENSTFTFPLGPPAEEVYTATAASSLTFVNVTATGFSSAGTADASSGVSVTGGSWIPAS